MIKYNIDKDWLTDQYITQNKTTKEIGEILGCSRFTISNRLKNFGIPVKPKFGKKPSLMGSFIPSEIEQKEWLTKQYTHQKKTTGQIAKLVGYKHAADIRFFLKKFEITMFRQNVKNPQLKSHELLNRDWLYYQYVVQRKTTREIAEIIGCIHVSVINYLKKFDISVRTNKDYARTGVKFSKMYPLLNDKDWLQSQYINQNKSTEEIAEIIGCSHHSVRVYLLEHKII